VRVTRSRAVVAAGCRPAVVARVAGASRQALYRRPGRRPRAAAPGPPGREERSLVDAGIDEVELRYPGIPRSDEPLTDLHAKDRGRGGPSMQGPGPSTQPAAGRDVDRGRRGEHRGGGFGVPRASWAPEPQAATQQVPGQAAPGHALFDRDQQDPDAYRSAIPGTERWQEAPAQPEREGEVVVGRMLAGKDPAETLGGHREHPPRDAR
jgi:hypothetical protein